VTKTSISIAWDSVSEKTSRYLVWLRRQSYNRRAFASTVYELVQNSTAQAYTATDLMVGTIYNFRVQALTADGAVGNEYVFTYRTDDDTANLSGMSISAVEGIETRFTASHTDCTASAVRTTWDGTLQRLSSRMRAWSEAWRSPSS